MTLAEDARHAVKARNPVGATGNGRPAVAGVTGASRKAAKRQCRRDGSVPPRNGLAFDNVASG